MTTKAGRPKGAKTKAREDIVIVRTQCPCGSRKKPKGQRMLREGDASGNVPGSGEPYSHYAHSHAQCADCGKALRISEYTTLPKDQLERELARVEYDEKLRELKNLLDAAYAKRDFVRFETLRDEILDLEANQPE